LAVQTTDRWFYAEGELLTMASAVLAVASAVSSFNQK